MLLRAGVFISGWSVTAEQYLCHGAGGSIESVAKGIKRIIIIHHLVGILKKREGEFGQRIAFKHLYVWPRWGLLHLCTCVCAQ